MQITLFKHVLQVTKGAVIHLTALEISCANFLATMLPEDGALIVSTKFCKI